MAELYAAVQPLVHSLDAYQAQYGEDDPEELTLMQLQDKEQAAQITSVLHDLYFLDVTYGEPRDDEGLAEEVGTLEDLHALREIAAQSQGKTADEYQEGGVPAGFLFNHLINHSDEDGYYLPVDFPQAFALEELSIGSSVALLNELDALEPILAEAFPDEVARAVATPDEDERAHITGPVGVWHSLRRLCRSSIALDLPVQFG